MSESKTPRERVKAAVYNDFGHEVVPASYALQIADELSAALQTIKQVADNIAGAPDNIVEWSAKVGNAIQQLDAALQRAEKAEVERDAMRGRLATIMGCLGTVLRDNGFGDNDVAIIRSELAIAIKSTAIDIARVKK